MRFEDLNKEYFGYLFSVRIKSVIPNLKDICLFENERLISLYCEKKELISNYYYDTASVIGLAKEKYSILQQKLLLGFQEYILKVIDIIFTISEENNISQRKFKKIIDMLEMSPNCNFRELNDEAKIQIVNKLINSVFELSKYFVFDNNNYNADMLEKYKGLLIEFAKMKKSFKNCFALCEYDDDCYYSISGIDDKNLYEHFKKLSNISKKDAVVYEQFYDYAIQIIEALIESFYKNKKICKLTLESISYVISDCNFKPNNVCLYLHPISLATIDKPTDERTFSCSEKKIIDKLLQESNLSGAVIKEGFQCTQKVNVLKKAKFWIRFKPCNFCIPALYGCESINFLSHKFNVCSMSLNKCNELKFCCCVNFKESKL